MDLDPMIGIFGVPPLRSALTTAQSEVIALFILTS